MRPLTAVPFVGAAAVILLLAGPAVAASAAPAASDWVQSFSVQNAYGMAFSQDDSTLYVAQRGQGVSAVSPSGSVTPVIQSNTSFMAVATESDGDLLVTVDSSPNIYRIDMADVAANPAAYLQNGYWQTKATVVYTSTVSPYLYSLAEAPDGTIYYSTYQDRQINVLRGGVSTPVLAQSAGAAFTAFSLLPNGGLVAVDENGDVYEIPASALAAGAVPASAIITLQTTDPNQSSYGIAFFDDGKTFYDGSRSKQSVVTPVTVPGAPSGLTATGSDGQAALSWTAPSIDGGAAVSGYVVQEQRNGAWVQVATPATTSATITGLTNGTPATLRVAAVNVQGTGAYSDPVAVTPFLFAPRFSANGAALAAGSVLTAGGPVTLTAEGLPSGAIVSLVLHSTPVTLATGTVGPTGSVQLVGTIPGATAIGPHTLVATLTTAGGATSSTLSVTIAPPAAAGTATGSTPSLSGTTQLANTGSSDAAALVIAAVLAMLVGGLAVRLRGRRARDVV